MLFFTAIHRCLLCRPLLSFPSSRSVFSWLLVQLLLSLMLAWLSGCLSFCQSLSFSYLLNCYPDCRLYYSACNMKWSVQDARLEVPKIRRCAPALRIRLHYFTLWSIPDVKGKYNNLSLSSFSLLSFFFSIYSVSSCFVILVSVMDQS